jgi:hypothetical protein
MSEGDDISVGCDDWDCLKAMKLSEERQKMTGMRVSRSRLHLRLRGGIKCWWWWCVGDEGGDELWMG